LIDFLFIISIIIFIFIQSIDQLKYSAFHAKDIVVS